MLFLKNIHECLSTLYLLHPHPGGAWALLQDETLSGGGVLGRGQGHLVPQHGRKYSQG